MKNVDLTTKFCGLTLKNPIIIPAGIHGRNGKVIKEEKLIEDLGRVRTVKIGPDGYIYVSIEQLGIVKLSPKEANQNN